MIGCLICCKLSDCSVSNYKVHSKAISLIVCVNGAYDYYSIVGNYDGECQSP